jgi:hypothetical protein
VWAGATTNPRSRHAPGRERPTARGDGARRHRDESFALGDEIARLAGAALVLHPAGEQPLLGRPARRFAVGLRAAEPSRPPPPRGRSADSDTVARVELLEGATPLSLDGELVLDAATGVPLLVKLRASFGTAADPALRTDVELDARVTAIGGKVGAVRAPAGARPDERKPDGPARALEAAGLREPSRAAAERDGGEAPAE